MPVIEGGDLVDSFIEFRDGTRFKRKRSLRRIDGENEQMSMNIRMEISTRGLLLRNLRQRTRKVLHRVAGTVRSVRFRSNLSHATTCLFWNQNSLTYHTTESCLVLRVVLCLRRLQVIGLHLINLRLVLRERQRLEARLARYAGIPEQLLWRGTCAVSLLEKGDYIAAFVEV